MCAHFLQKTWQCKESALMDPAKTFGLLAAHISCAVNVVISLIVKHIANLER